MVSFAPWRDPQAALLSRAPLNPFVPTASHLPSTAPAGAISGNGCFHLSFCPTVAMDAANDSSSDAGSHGSPRARSELKAKHQRS
jgi:hypothetical protein